MTVARLEGHSHKPRNPGCHQQLNEAGQDPPLEPLDGAQPCGHLDFGLLAFRTGTEYIPVVLSPPVHGTSFLQPQEMHTTVITGFGATEWRRSYWLQGRSAGEVRSLRQLSD